MCGAEVGCWSDQNLAVCLDPPLGEGSRFGGHRVRDSKDGGQRPELTNIITL